MDESVEWKRMFNNYYVSSDGRVYSLFTNKVLKPAIDRYGYYKVTLTVNNKLKYITVHRLVASAFIPNPNNLPQVNHKDENKLNNNVENLEWCDAKYNSNYGTRSIRVGLSGRKPINQISLNGEYIKTWSGACEIEKELGITHGQIFNCCRGRDKTAHGYIWKYKEEK